MMKLEGVLPFCWSKKVLIPPTVRAESQSELLIAMGSPLKLGVQPAFRWMRGVAETMAIEATARTNVLKIIVGDKKRRKMNWSRVKKVKRESLDVEVK